MIGANKKFRTAKTLQTEKFLKRQVKARLTKYARTGIGLFPNRFSCETLVVAMDVGVVVVQFGQWEGGSEFFVELSMVDCCVQWPSVGHASPRLSRGDACPALGQCAGSVGLVAGGGDSDDNDHSLRYDILNLVLIIIILSKPIRLSNEISWEKEKKEVKRK